MKSLFTIRKKKHVKHPQIVVDADKTKFSSVSLSHSETDSRHLNIKLDDNPNSVILNLVILQEKLSEILSSITLKNLKNISYRIEI